MNAYMKAIVGALIAALTALGAAYTDGGVSPSEWIVVATAALTTFAGVWAVPNKPTA